MIVGGYSMHDDSVNGETCITVIAHESGASFFLQGDAVDIFKCEWRIYQLRVDNSFEDFLYSHDYNTLFHTPQYDGTEFVIEGR